MDAPVVDATEQDQENERYSGRPEKQAAILEAAIAVFLREGYEGASVDTIAAEANVSKRTIYNHFGDKKLLFVEAMDRVRERAALDSAMDESLFSSAQDLHERAVAYAERVAVGFMQPEYSAVRRVVTSELLRHPELKQLCMESASPKRLKAQLASKIEQATQEGVLDCARPALAAEQFFGLLMHSLNVEALFGARDLTDEQISRIADDTVTFFLRAYDPRQ